MSSNLALKEVSHPIEAELSALERANGDLVPAGYEVVIHCESCWHQAPVDLQAAMQANGEAGRFPAFVKRATCARCGSHWPKVAVAILPVKERR